MNFKTLPLKPYARILTMLGDQLIKNETIALLELLKNSYDADAKWVKVTFENFGQNYETNDDSAIVIEDNGHGMTMDIIENHFLNPATPEKKLRKNLKNTTNSGRIIQGEKGIGRFAILKLGQAIKITTKAAADKFENEIFFDFSEFDEDFLDSNNNAIFLDQLDVKVSTRQPEMFMSGGTIQIGLQNFKRSNSGTKIEIKKLKGAWNKRKIERIYEDVAKLQPIFHVENKNPDFLVGFYKDNEYLPLHKDYIRDLRFLLEERSFLKIENGHFDVEQCKFNFDLNGKPVSLSLFSEEIKGLSVFNRVFGKGGTDLVNRSIECGSFDFSFYIFDFSNTVDEKFKLDVQDKNKIKAHRIYLYRDGIRVYPYGEPDDDWLQTDTYRGTISAGAFLSNDQVVGVVDISQAGNPQLRDKTNREGLIDEGNATKDFIALLKIILGWVRAKPYKARKLDFEKKQQIDKRSHEHLIEDFKELDKLTKDNRVLNQLVTKTHDSYVKEVDYLKIRAEKTEALAGVGLSVETASHDITASMHQVVQTLDDLSRSLKYGKDINIDELISQLMLLRGTVGFVQDQLKNIQALFQSTKQRSKNIRVKDIVEKVENIYRAFMTKNNVTCTINNSISSPLIAKTTDAVLLQVFINLFDNSVYWLSQTDQTEKKIQIDIDGGKGELIFSDNGPGINNEDIPYIFEAFYSGKGEDGRGLGLYIARQLLERYDYEISYVQSPARKILPGANFKLSFITED